MLIRTQITPTEFNQYIAILLEKNNQVHIENLRSCRRTLDLKQVSHMATNTWFFSSEIIRIEQRNTCEGNDYITLSSNAEVQSIRFFLQRIGITEEEINQLLQPAPQPAPSYFTPIREALSNSNPFSWFSNKVNSTDNCQTHDNHHLSTAIDDTVGNLLHFADYDGKNL